jgi:bacteriorhodopsin
MWILYPITHILYKIEIIDIYTTVCIYVTLDILCKGIFTNLLLGAREIYSNSKPLSWIGCFTKKIIQIYPIESKYETEYDTVYVVDLNNISSIFR